METDIPASVLAAALGRSDAAPTGVTRRPIVGHSGAATAGIERVTGTAASGGEVLEFSLIHWTRFPAF